MVIAFSDPALQRQLDAQGDGDPKTVVTDPIDRRWYSVEMQITWPSNATWRKAPEISAWVQIPTGQALHKRAQSLEPHSGMRQDLRFELDIVE